MDKIIEKELNTDVTNIFMLLSKNYQLFIKRLNVILMFRIEKCAVLLYIILWYYEVNNADGHDGQGRNIKEIILLLHHY